MLSFYEQCDHYVCLKIFIEYLLFAKNIVRPLVNKNASAFDLVILLLEISL